MSGPASAFAWGLEPRPEDSAFLRLWHAFATARVALGLAILALLVLLQATAPLAEGIDSRLLAGCLAYVMLAVAVRVAAIRPPARGPDPRWLATCGVDLLAVAALQAAEPGALSFAPLFAVPVLMAGVLAGGAVTLATTAAASALLLAQAWGQGPPGEEARRLLQAAPTALGYCALALLAHQMAARLARAEQRSRQSQEAARVQAQVNELVIESLADGILVVDTGGRVRAANPMACSLLGVAQLPAGRSLDGDPGWAPLHEMAGRALAEGLTSRGEVVLGLAGREQRRVFVRARPAATHVAAGSGSLCVLFLEDLREVEARTRTEKLAAMGRMSAAVAHEIRNPLAAITQANDLLDESLSDPGQRQLSALVGQNARRLGQVVDEILNLVRVQQQDAGGSQLLALDAGVAATCGDWARQNDAGERLRIELRAPQARVRFEPDHLRRVLVNLLDNALRHAGAAPGAIQVATQPRGPQSLLLVWSDGAPLEAGVQRHLFEPFFSSRSRSTGLGLYICRELCERHGAQIGYRRGPAPLGGGHEGNIFFVSFAPVGATAGYSSPATIPV